MKDKYLLLTFELAQRYLQGYAVGDGSMQMEGQLYLYGQDSDWEGVKVRAEFVGVTLKRRKHSKNTWVAGWPKKYLPLLGDIADGWRISKERGVVKSVMGASSKEKFAFLSGLFDSDGSISFNERGFVRPRVNCMIGTASERLARETSILLDDLGVSNGVSVHRREDGRISISLYIRSRGLNILAENLLLQEKKQVCLSRAAEMYK